MAEKPQAEGRSNDPQFPSDPEFYRRVLHHAPTPLLVVDRQAQLIYANQAMIQLGNWDYVPGKSALDFIHPDDRASAAAQFVAVVESPSARVLGGRLWPEIHVRLVAADGTVIPVEIVGTGGTLEDAVNGMVYSVRPARSQHLMGRILERLSHGAPMHQMLALAGEMIALPPLDLDAVVMQSDPLDHYTVAASTSFALAEVMRSPLDDFWKTTSAEPAVIYVQDMPATVADQLSSLGYNAFWATTVESPLTPTTLRIIAGSPTKHTPDGGVIDRMLRAREIAGAILLRTQTGVLLQHAAAHDLLTNLPNRAAFYQLAEAIAPDQDRAALHLNLDGLKTVNSALGQATGDALLQVVSDRIRAACASDDTIARIGDDEFSILLTPHKHGESLSERAITLATTIRDALAEPIIIAGRPLNMSTSIGVAAAKPGESTGQLLAWAEAALQDAKTGSDDRIVKFGVTFG